MFKWFKKTPKIQVGDFVSYQWRGNTEVEQVIKIVEDGEYVFPTEQSQRDDNPVWEKKTMATVLRKAANDLPYMFPIDKLHKMTNDEMMLWKLENA